MLCIKKNLNASDVERYIKRIAEVRKVSVESLEGYKKMMLGFLGTPPPGFDVNGWAARQVYLALGMLLTTAALLKIDACPMEGFDAAVYNKTLKLEEQGYSATVVCTLGYRAQDDGYASAPKVRYNGSEVVGYIK